MHSMKKPVDGGCQHDTNISNKNDTAEKCIKRGKKLAKGVVDSHNGTHSAQDHTGIVQGIKPSYVRGIMIPQHTEQQTKEHNTHSKHETLCNTPFEYADRGDGLMFVFEHA